MRDLNLLSSVSENCPNYWHSPFLFLYALGRIINFPLDKTKKCYANIMPIVVILERLDFLKHEQKIIIMKI